MIEYTNFSKREVGYEYNTRYRLVSPTEIDMFCIVSGMMQEEFLRDEAAQALGLGFKGRPAPGAFVLGMMFGLLLEEHVKGAVYMGSESVEFVKPVHPFDWIRVEGKVLDKKEVSKGQRFIITYEWRVMNQDDVLCAEGINTCVFPRY